MHLLAQFLTLALIVFLNCRHVHCDQDVTTSTAPAGNRVCGHFNVSDDASFDIYDRENHNLAFAQILASDDIHEKIYSVNIQPDCELIYCYIDLIHGKKRNCEWMTNFVDLTPEKYTVSYFEGKCHGEVRLSLIMLR